MQQTIYELLPKYRAKLVFEQSRETGANKLAEVKKFISKSYQAGGKAFVYRCKRYGTTEKGYPLKIDPWFEEALELIGDLRVSHVIVSGAAQIGKTLSVSLFFVDLLVSGKLNVAWFYATREALNVNVPEQFRPIVEYWIENFERITGKKLQQTEDRTTNSRYQVDKATAIFSYTSTSKTTQSREGLAKVGGSAASFQANALVIEESSQHPPSAKDVAPRRLDASLIPTKPIRELGTPGSGQGIERIYSQCDYEFYPHATCTNCKNIFPLDPKGCLLKPSQITDSLGRTKESFFSATGRPLEWFHSEPSNSLGSSFIGCPVCGQPVSERDRVNSRFICRRTKVSLRTFLDSLPKGIPEKFYKVAIIYSPLLRRSPNNLAAEIIADGLNCQDPTDWQQQRLGHPSEITQDSLTIEILERAIKAPYIPIENSAKSVRVCGIDQGRSSDWLIVSEIVLPINWQDYETSELFEYSTRNVLYGSDVNRDDIPKILEDYEVTFGIIDNEPDRESALRLCAETGILQMGDQRSRLEKIVKLSTVEDGGRKIAAWHFRDSKFKQSVFDCLLGVSPRDSNPIMRLPKDWAKWIGNPSERSPVRHLMSVKKDPATGWQRTDHVDDLFFALMFSELAFYLYLEESVFNSQWLREV